jgi:hypothetical protein
MHSYTFTRTLALNQMPKQGGLTTTNVGGARAESQTAGLVDSFSSQLKVSESDIIREEKMDDDDVKSVRFNDELEDDDLQREINNNPLEANS